MESLSKIIHLPVSSYKQNDDFHCSTYKKEVRGSFLNLKEPSVKENYLQKSLASKNQFSKTNQNEYYGKNISFKRNKTNENTILLNAEESFNSGQVQFDGFDGDFQKTWRHWPNKKIEENLSKCFRKTTSNTPDRQKVPFKYNENVCRVFTGSVQNLYIWSKLHTDLDIMYEVIGTVEHIQTGQWNCEKILLLSDSRTGPTVQVFYYEIDRALSSIPIRSTVICVGKMTVNNKFQAFKVSATSDEDKRDSQRIAFICNRVADEITAMTKIKAKTQELNLSKTVIDKLNYN